VAKRGRKPKRAALRGTWPAEWSPPKYLSPEARAAWAHLVELLEATGNLERTDPVLVEAYAINVALLRQAQEAIQLDGPTVTTCQGTLIAHPMVSAINSASMRVKSIITDLGLCPAAAKHASGGAQQATPGEDKWEGLLGVVS
jgi:P27 family predicted phage terminase small subunit